MKLGPGNTFYEHITPDKLDGLNDIDNCATLCRTCWRSKTSGYDRPVIDKSRRQQDRNRGIRKPRTITGWRRFDGTPVYASRHSRIAE